MPGMDIPTRLELLNEGEIPVGIDVLDEDFGQPYDYQWILSQNPDFAYARQVAANVERELRVLADAGVLVGWKEGMYV